VYIEQTAKASFRMFLWYLVTSEFNNSLPVWSLNKRDPSF